MENMMVPKREEIKVDLHRFLELVLIEDHYYTLIECLFRNAALGYDYSQKKKILRFDDAPISQILQIYQADDFEGTLETLLKEKENSDE